MNLSLAEREWSGRLIGVVANVSVSNMAWFPNLSAESPRIVTETRLPTYLVISRIEIGTTELLAKLEMVWLCRLVCKLLFCRN